MLIAVLVVLLLTFSQHTYSSPSFVVANKEIQEQLQSSFRLLHSAPDDSLSKALNALAEARKHNDQESEMYALVLLGKIYEFKEEARDAGAYYKSAQAIESRLGASKRDPDISYFLADGLRLTGGHQEALHYINAGIEIQRIFGNNEYLMRAYDLKSSLHYSLKEYQQSELSSEAALKLAESLEQEELMLRSYRKVAKAAKKLGHPKRSLEFNLKALGIARATGDEKLIARHREYVSTDQRVLGMYSPALDNAKRALVIQRQYGDRYRISNLLLNISIIYMKLSSHDQSLAYAFELLSLHENTDNKNRIASACNQIGLIFSRLNRLDDATDYHQRVLDLGEDNVKQNYRASALRSLATIKLKTSDHLAALEYAQQAKNIYARIKDQSGVATALFTSAEIHYALEDIDKALAFQKSVISIASDLGDRWAESRSKIYVGKLLLQQSLNHESRSALLEGISIAEAIGAKSLMLEGYSLLISAERKLGNNLQALNYYDTAFELIREIDNSEVDQRIAELKIVHDTREREREIESLRRNMQISQLEISQQAAELENLNNKNIIASLELREERSKHIYLLGIAIIFGLILSFLFMRFRYLSTSQKILNDRNKEIELKNAHLAELNLTKDRFFSILSHDLRSPVANIIARTDMLYEMHEKLERNKVKSYIREIFSSSNQVYSLLENLLSWASVQLKNANPLYDLHYAHEICDAVVHELKSAAEEKEINLVNTVPLDARLYADKNMIRTALRNLVANAIKFTPHEGIVNICSEARGDKITIHVKDSGVGIKKEEQNRIFNISSVTSKQGTDGEQGTGLGLTLCKTLIEKNRGDLGVNSEEGMGSDFFFTLPAKKYLKYDQ